MEMLVELYSPASMQARPLRGHKTDDQRNRLDLNLPADIKDNVSVTTLLCSYRKTYTSDPVTEEDFVQLILELRPEILDTIDGHSHAAGTDAESIPVAQSADNLNGRHNAIKENDHNLETHPNDVFKEFVSGWKNIRPGGAWSRGSATSRPQRRSLNVLSWEFG